MSKIKDPVGAGGFFRLQIVEGEGSKKKVVSDSGWHKNQITNLGAQEFLVKQLAGAVTTATAGYLALGTGTAPASTATALPGELTDAAGCRIAISTNTSIVASRTLQMLGTLNSNVITAARTINNIGIFAVSTTGAGTVFAGNTYTTSALATNQAVNMTYQIQFP